MTSRWPQNQQDARWPYSDAYDAPPGGRVATDSDRGDRSSAYFGGEHPSAPLPVTREPLGRGRAADGDRGGRSSADFGAEHPSAPLPVTRDPQRRDRRGRGKSRDDGRFGSDGGDADYDWIQYLGEAGPAQGQSQRPADVPPATSRSRRAQPPANADDRRGRSGGMLPRRHAAEDPADRMRPSYPASQPGLPAQATSQQAYPSADARTTAPPTTPAHPDQYRARADGYRTRTDEYRTRTDEYRTPADDSHTWPGRSAVMPEPSSRAGRHAPGSTAPWAVAPPPAEARLAPPDQAQRPVSRRAAEPVGTPATNAFDRPTQVTTAPAKTAPAPVQTAPAPAKTAPAPAKTGRAQKRAKDERGVPARKPARRKRRHPVLVGLVGGGLVGAVAAGGLLATGALKGTGSGPAHRIVTPDKMLAYVQDPSLAKGMGASALRAEIVAKGSGEASHVVDAVYEDTAGAAAKSNPRILLFVGGNLSGSAGSFISGFTQSLAGAFVIKAGPLGGQAACVPGAGGHPAECVWADNDTFGLVASPALSATTLAGELRSVRPLVERRVK